ncbi:hypothetical protein COCNU_02G013180 [Cocos nucifera]|uniref:Uncharacterized protein n=1 Tax=Cocos nucifera TaxID=13894 RepID=A0A8K0HZI3_COCNU|nr:hypothetical protein COCNU_02G013180 [Cocos nucifera]
MGHRLVAKTASLDATWQAMIQLIPCFAPVAVSCTNLTRQAGRRNFFCLNGHHAM